MVLNKTAEENGSPESLAFSHCQAFLVAHLSPGGHATDLSPFLGAFFPRCTCIPPMPLRWSLPSTYHDVHRWQALQHAVRCQ